MQIKGVVKTSSIEYPGKIATVVFTGGCNFRCPYCYNVDLVLRPESLPDIEPEETLRLLASRKGFVDGVVISGGEPTLQPDLAEFAQRVRELGCAVKLDTNGYRPQVLRQLLERGLLDYVAMDIKATLDKYSLATGKQLDGRHIEESIALILSSGIEHEFRTTMVPGIVAPDDVKEIASMIAGAQRYFLQQFRPQTTLAPPLAKTPPYPAAALEKTMETISGLVGEVGLRGF